MPTSDHHLHPAPEMTTDPSLTVDLGGTGVTVSVHDERSPGVALGDVVERLSAAIADALTGEGAHTGSVDVLLVDLATITRLNSEHMGVEAPTDVLSFPLDDPSEGDSFGFVPHIGDIVLCPSVARTQAAEHAGTFDSEMLLLSIHAALHLLGHDHDDDDARSHMQALEATYLRPYGIDHPGDQR
jgi:probable rRNA maturation factor